MAQAAQPNNIFSLAVRQQANMNLKRDASIRWLRDRVTQAPITAGKIINEMDHRQKSSVIVGKMYLFQYSAKHDKTLPYWDAAPLIFPIDISWGYVLGLNFHYLDYRLRAIMLDQLWQFTNNTRLDQYTRLRLSYQLLKQSSASKYVKPTIHKYLATHVRSNFLLIDPSEWMYALWLPVQDWRKASQTQVWKDSRAKMRS